MFYARVVVALAHSTDILWSIWNHGIARRHNSNHTHFPVLYLPYVRACNGPRDVIALWRRGGAQTRGQFGWIYMYLGGLVWLLFYYYSSGIGSALWSVKGFFFCTCGVFYTGPLGPGCVLSFSQLTQRYFRSWCRVIIEAKCNNIIFWCYSHLD